MRRAILFAGVIAALVLTGGSITGAMAASADAPLVMPSPWTGFTVLGAMILIFILEIV